MITVDSLSYFYPKITKPALDNVSLHITQGEFLILAGSSGSGKSTLLRSLNGLIPHFSGGVVHGSVHVNSIDVIEAGPRKLSQIIGFVSQNPENQALLDRVEPEIAFALENAAIPAQEMRVRVEEVLDLMDLAPLRQRQLTSLSGGERQRVAIASVLALRPQILLLDEPTSQLDPQSAEKVLLSLVRLNEDLGLTILVAEHRLERVLRYADRLVYMDNGRISIDDSIHAAVYAMPQLPPLVQLGRDLGWTPLPLTVKEGRRSAARVVAQMQNKAKKTDLHQNNLFESEPPILKTSAVQCSYSGIPILNGIDLVVNRGEVVALMGRNGSGKSTFLKCVIGLHQPSEGDIEINGLSTRGREVAELAQEVAYLPQNPDDLLFAETVYNELQITLANHDMTDNDEIHKLLDELGLAGDSGSYPRDLSTGQRQRVAMGAVTITQPKLLLLDEPTRGLDSKTKETLVNIWRRWLAKGLGLLIVTHDVELVAKIADRVMILSQGEIIASGQTRDVLATSPLFAPQIARLFPGQGWLTAEDALDSMHDHPHSQ